MCKHTSLNHPTLSQPPPFNEWRVRNLFGSSTPSARLSLPAQRKWRSRPVLESTWPTKERIQLPSGRRGRNPPGTCTDSSTLLEKTTAVDIEDLFSNKWLDNAYKRPRGWSINCGISRAPKYLVHFMGPCLSIYLEDLPEVFLSLILSQATPLSHTILPLPPSISSSCYYHERPPPHPRIVHPAHP